VTARFVVVRHGETRWNVAGRIQGHADSPLTDTGLAQAEAIAHRLARERFDRLVASDLGRARRTAEAIARLTGHAVESDPRLRERHFGEGEGLTYEEIDARFPDAFSRTRETDPDYVVPGGESRRQFFERVRGAFEDIASASTERRVAVVCHGGVLAALYRHVNGWAIAEPRAIAIPNAAYNALARGPDGWRVEAWADTAHLDSATGAFVEP